MEETQLDDLLREFSNVSNKMLEEAYKFDVRGNKSAGTRCRKLCQELKTTLKEIRNRIQTTKKGA